jgi:hypothetical protein
MAILILQLIGVLVTFGIGHRLPEQEEDVQMYVCMYIDDDDDVVLVLFTFNSYFGLVY